MGEAEDKIVLNMLYPWKREVHVVGSPQKREFPAPESGQSVAMSVSTAVETQLGVYGTSGSPGWQDSHTGEHGRRGGGVRR